MVSSQICLASDSNLHKAALENPAAVNAPSLKQTDKSFPQLMQSNRIKKEEEKKQKTVLIPSTASARLQPQGAAQIRS